MMPGLVTAKDLTRWNSEVSWPWGEKPGQPLPQPEPLRQWRDAASADSSHGGGAKWTAIAGLGASGRAMAVEPAGLASTFSESAPDAPALQYTFQSRGGDTDALLDFLPTFSICPGMKLRVAVALDNRPPAIVEVPESGAKDLEKSPGWKAAVQNEYVRAQVPLPGLAPGPHTLRISAMDPGIVLDRVSLP
jgi:hypothetical protein